MKNFLSEDDIEVAVMRELVGQDLPWRQLNCYAANADDLADGSGRSDKSEVVFLDILRERLALLNPDYQLKKKLNIGKKW